MRGKGRERSWSGKVALADDRKVARTAKAFQREDITRNTLAHVTEAHAPPAFHASNQQISPIP